MVAPEFVIRLERAVTTIEDHERRLDDIEEVAPAVIAAEVRALRNEVKDLKEEVKAAKRAWWAVAISVLAGVLVWAITAYQIWGSAPG